MSTWESKVNALSQPPLEFAHETDERINAGFRKCIVNGGAHATNEAMTFEPVEACRCRFLIESLLQIFRWQPKRDVHQRAAVLLGGPPIKSSAIDFRIELCGLTFICRLNCANSAGRAQPFHGESQDINAKCIGSV